MQLPQQSRSASALASHVRGVTLELVNPEYAPVVGATPVDRFGDDDHDLSGMPDGSADAIVTQGGIDRLADPVATVGQWRRVLHEGGTLALTCETGRAPRWLVSVVQLVGGFEVRMSRPMGDDGPWLLVGTRQAVQEVRAPLGTLGPAFAECVSSSENTRAELYFQIGTILLQCGDAGLAEKCFQTMLELEPGNADALFGRGMCLGAREDWGRALTELQRALCLDPDNAELQRWVELARRQSPADADAETTPVPVGGPSDETPPTSGGALRI